MAKLIGMSGDFKGREFPLKDGETTVGRKADNEIMLDHPTISSHHCKILLEDGACTLQDMGSTNGSRVNSIEVHEGALHNKDLIQLGSIEFMVDAPELASDTARYADGNDEMVTGSLETPQDFGTISPFGDPPKEKPGLWYFLLVIFGVLAIVGVLAVLAVILVG